MKTVTITTEYIKLDQFMKLANIVSSGGEARFFIEDNSILVNGEDEKRRGKKLRHGDSIQVNGIDYAIKQAGADK
ncbi:MAG: S4 domain-containing protein YaaA [Clostridia bacterium]|nr:S4 domain-containing protein YaaA [Clostridia bacterium]